MNIYKEVEQNVLGAIDLASILSFANIGSGIVGGSTGERANLEAFGQTLDAQVTNLRIEVSNLRAQRDALVLQARSLGLAGVNGLSGFLFFGNKKEKLRKENEQLQAERDQLVAEREGLIREVVKLQTLLTGSTNDIGATLMRLLPIGLATIAGIVIVKRLVT